MSAIEGGQRIKVLKYLMSVRPLKMCLNIVPTPINTTNNQRKNLYKNIVTNSKLAQKKFLKIKTVENIL